MKKLNKIAVGVVFLMCLLKVDIALGQLTMTACTNPTGGLTSAFSGVLGSTAGVNITFTGTPTGCYAYGFQYNASWNGFKANGTSCANPTNCTGGSETPVYAAAERWGGGGTTPGPTLSNGNKTVTFMMADQSVTGCVNLGGLTTSRNWRSITLTLTITGGNAAQVWTVSGGNVYVPLTSIANANGISINVKETALFNGALSQAGVNIANCFQGCGTGTLVLCSHITFGYYQYSNILPNIAPTGATSSCLNYTGLSSTPSGGTSPYTYAWSPATALSATNVANPTVNAVVPGQPYTVTVTDVNSCTAKATSGAITTVANPSGGSIATVNYCSSTSSGSVSIAGVTNVTDYVWSLPAGLTGSSTSSSITVNGSTAGTYTVTATPRNTLSGVTCTGTPVTGTVNVVDLPTANAGNALPDICKGGTSAALGGSVGGGATGGTWSDGGVGGSFSPSATTLNATYTPPATYTGLVTLTLTAVASPCTDVTATKTITVIAPPTVNAGAALAAICKGGTSDPLGGSVGGGATGGTWSDAAAGGSFSPSSTDVNATYTPPPTYTGSVILILTATATSPCINVAASKTLDVYALPSISAQPPATAAQCPSGAVTLGLTATGGTPSLTYDWQYNNAGTWASATNGTPSGSVYTGATTSSAFNVSGLSGAGSTYDYRCVVSASGNNCGSVTSNTTTVTVNALPNPTLSLDNCAMGGGASSYEIILATISTTNTTPNYIYTLPVGATQIWSDATGANKIFKQPMGGSALTYNVIDNSGAGCAGSASITSSPNGPIDIPLTSGNGSKTADCSQKGFNSWTHYKDITNSDNVLISILDNGVDLGTVNVTTYVDASTPNYSRTCQGASYPYYAMKRHFKITSSNFASGAAFPSAVGVRLYFTPAEATDLNISSMLQTGTDCNDDDDFLDPTLLTDLYLTKYTGNNEDGDYDNNDFTSGLFKVYGPATTPRLAASPNSFLTIFPTGVANYNYVELDINELSEFWLHGTEHGTGLPVNFLYFTARAVENTFIKLEWATGTEIDNRGYEVQRSEDGVNFTRIGWIDGVGNSSATNYYYFDDRSAMYDRNYYYRLRQVDNSGKSKNSLIVTARLTFSDKFTVSEFIPNLVESSSYLDIFTTKDRVVEVDVFNAIGQKVTTVKRQLQRGHNTIDFDFTGLAKGMYSAAIKSNGDFIARKFIMIMPY